MTTQTRRASDVSYTRWLVNIASDVRVLQTIGQVVFAVAVIAFLVVITNGILDTTREQNITPNFAFLDRRSGFDISERPSWYTNDSTFLDAFIVGLLNTGRIVSIGLVAATTLGILVGIFLLSSNYLVRTIARVYVEMVRNTPLFVQLIIWYFIVMFSLPVVQNSFTFPREGVWFIPLRLLLYPAVIYIASLYLKRQALRREVIGGGLAMAFIIEGGFWLGNRYDSWADVYSKGDILAPLFMVYFAASIAVIVVWMLPSLAPAFKSVRVRALCLSVGQLIGGLLFYFGIVPKASFRTEIYPALYINNRGFVFPQIVTTTRFVEWMLFVIVGLVAAAVLWTTLRRTSETTGKVIPYVRYSIITMLVFAIGGWLLVGIEPHRNTVEVVQDEQAVTMTVAEASAAGLLTLEDRRVTSESPLLVLLPKRTGFNFNQGKSVTPEYMALLLGLTIYTSSFIAEIVRAGIQAVPYGQIEAARSIGLPYGRTLRLVVLPQALRVIIPPLGNQYLNLAKNSSLALAIAYPDLFQVTTTIMNTSGQSVAGMLMVMLTYLLISLSISAVTNYVNRRLRLVTN